MWAHDPCPTDLAPDDGMVSFLIGTKRSVWGSGYFWGETLWNSYFLASILRYTITLEGTWLVNSAAHMYGKQPYDKLSSPWQNPLVGLGAIGECSVESQWGNGSPDVIDFVGGKVFMAIRKGVKECREIELWSWHPSSSISQASSLLYGFLICQTGNSNISLVEHTNCSVPRWGIEDDQ